jgi:hypothetical protein
VSGTLVRFAALAALAFPAMANPPDACSVLTLEEVNAIAAVPAVRTQVNKAGNPTECGFIDAKRAAVLVVSMREVQYAAENELQIERENLEKIYRSKVKWLDGIGDRAFWMPVNKQLVFRKARTLVWVKFARGSNQTEIDNAQIARLVETKLK